MRTTHWFFVLSVALFVSGIAFVLAGARAARLAPAAVRTIVVPTVGPMASVKQIMKGITGPAATTIFNAVSTSVTTKGTEEIAPKNDAEWEVVENAAAALIESGNLMLVGDRVVDKGDWVKMSKALIDAGQVAMRAAQAKNADGISDAGEPVNASCDSCHLRYQRGS